MTCVRTGPAQTRNMTEEITQLAFDESGSDGENLATATHAVFAHGSCALSVDEASEFMSELRARIGSRSLELKSREALKPDSRPDFLDLVREFDLANDKANVYLAEKSYFLAGKMISLLVEEAAYDRGVILGPDQERAFADILHSRIASGAGEDVWRRMLVSFNRLVKQPASRARGPERGPRDSQPFVQALWDAKNENTDKKLAPVLDLLWEARSYAASFETVSESILRELDPTIPSLVAGAGTWGMRLDGAPFEIIHDEHWALTPDSIAVAVAVAPMNHFLPGGDLRGITLAHSEDDERVQVADLVAGLGRLAVVPREVVNAG